MNKIISILCGVCVFMFGFVTYAYAGTTFGVSLGYGSTQKDEITKLQTFLFQNGYLKVAPTGKYLSMTKQAVAEFQKNEGIEASGYFGPLTRDAANKKSGLGVVKLPQSSVTTQSVENNESQTALVLSATSKKIRWTTAGYPAGVGVDINLLRKVSDSPKRFDLVRVIASDAPNSGSLVWVAGKGETGTDMYVEIACSRTYVFKNGCKMDGGPVQMQ